MRGVNVRINRLLQSAWKPEKEPAGPSTTLRSGRDDNFVMQLAHILDKRNTASLQMNCHPDRSAA